MKYLGLTLWVVFCLSNAKAQFTLDDIKSFELGQRFSEAQSFLGDKFGDNISVYKGNIEDIYKIELPKKDTLWVVKKNRPEFDGYGDCQYSFMFAKNILVGIDVRFEFLATEGGKENFAKLLEIINADFSEDKDFHLISTSGEDLQIDKIINDVNNNCDVKEANETYFKQSAVLGTKAWEIHKRVDNVPRHKFLSLQVYKIAINSTPYTGCVAVIELTISNEAFIGLYNQVSGMKIQYKELPGE